MNWATTSRTSWGSPGGWPPPEHANPANSNTLSVAVELQADCLAGVWAHSTYTRNLLEPGDLEAALNAAGAVGDDFLQQLTGGESEPESWTHGSSAQRQQWLTTGFDGGSPAACNTFTGTGTGTGTSSTG